MDEFSAIKRYFLNALMPDHVRLGPGDDCAVMSVKPGYELCVSTDTLLEAVHFPTGAKPTVIAERTMVANLSDLAAMGAIPQGMTLALTLPTLDAPWLEAFSTHAQQLSERYECPIVGGNMAQGPMSITITVMGITPNEQALTRSGAQLGHGIYVSGDVGAAAGAVQQLDVDHPSSLLLSHYEQPVPQLRLGQSLLGVASSAIDLSDGLISDLHHILQASLVGAHVEVDTIPMIAELIEVFGDSRALALAMHGGDDYQLCFTADASRHDEVMAIAQSLDVKVTRIGQITDEVCVARSHLGELLIAQGYQHFQQNDEPRP